MLHLHVAHLFTSSVRESEVEQGSPVSKMDLPLLLRPYVAQAAQELTRVPTRPLIF